jgi:hypothetical protein
VLGRDDGAYAKFFASQTMIAFGVIAGVGHHSDEPNRSLCVAQQRRELIDVWPWPSADAHCQNEVAVGVRDHAQLGVMMVNHGFPGLANSTSPSHEVGASRAAFQTGRVHGGRADLSAAAIAHPDGPLEQPLGRAGSQQPPAGLL